METVAWNFGEARPWDKEESVNAGDFSDESDFSIVYYFNIASQNIFLGGGLNSMNAL